MYLERLMEISRAENGFVVTVTVPMKPSAEDKCCAPTMVDGGKSFVCYDEEGLLTKIQTILPLLTAPDPEQQMEQVFKEASANE